MDSEILTCHVDAFLDSYLPNGHLHTFDAVVADLKKQRLLVARGSSLSQQASSSTHKAPYTHIFKTFKTLFRSRSINPSRIIRSFQSIANGVRKALGKFGGLAPSDFAIREMGSGDDEACLTDNLDGELHPTDVVVPITVIGRQTDRGEADEMDAAYVSRVSDIVNKDPRRRFTYGVTFEHDQVALWYLGRSRIVKSSTFKVNQHPDLLVKALISVFLATEEGLGYDPLVSRLADGSYVYELPADADRREPLFYRTVGLLSEYCSPLLTGRRAWIWRVKQILSKAQPDQVLGTSDRVLKDVSLDEEVKTEFDIQQELFSDIGALARDKNWREKEMIRHLDACTIQSIADALDGDNFRRYFSCIIAKHVGTPIPTTSAPAQSSRKRRCFFVYEDLCIPLYSIPTLGEAVDLMKQCLTALRLMFCAGWVHRDVSPGNILAVRPTPNAQWSVKLSDLEFSQRFPDPRSNPKHEMIGTPPFMACEIHAATHIMPVENWGRIEPGEPLPVHPGPKGPVVYSYQHDLESLWWVMLWLAMARVKHDLPRTFGETFFDPDKIMHNGLARMDIFTRCIVGMKMVDESLPQSLRPFVVCLENLRRDLYESYISRNRDDKIDVIGTYADIIGQAFGHFFDVADRYRREWESLDLIVPGDRQPLQPSTGMTSDDSPQARTSPHTQLGPKKRKSRDPYVEQSAPKRPRRNPAQIPDRPITRSMTRINRPVTRSQTRRLQQKDQCNGGRSRP